MFTNDSLRPLPWIVSLAVLSAVSCDKGESAGSVPGYTKIDDMEGEGGRIAWSPPAGWLPGFWTSTTDCAQAHKILPEPYFRNAEGWDYDRVPSPYQTMPGSPPSTHAAHLRTKFNESLENVWGANIGFDFAERPVDDGAAPWPPATDLDAGSSTDGKGCRQGSSRDFNGPLVDLSAYSGITFWAKAASHGRQSIRVQINNAHTDPRGGECTSGDSGDGKNCYNGYGKALMLTDSFTQYRITFAEMRQDPGWANPSLDPFPPQEGAFSMNFAVPLPGCVDDTVANCAGGTAPVSFDVWIDDLYFENAP